jgi:hypothetical protein
MRLDHSAPYAYPREIATVASNGRDLITEASDLALTPGEFPAEIELYHGCDENHYELFRYICVNLDGNVLYRSKARKLTVLND